MNTARDLSKRLLHLFPIKIIKEYFQVTGNADDIIENLTGNKTFSTLKDFAAANYQNTRQNIYIYELLKNFNRRDIDSDFPFTIENETLINGEYTFFCLPKTTFSVYLSNPTEKQDLIFFQPVFIRVRNKQMIIHYTKLEKNVHSYFPESREAKKAGQLNPEIETLHDILFYLSTEYLPVSADINRGIKHLWEIDDIDCHKIQWRKPFSVSMETMNADLTFKAKYPEEYKKIILAPLEKTIFKYLRGDALLCEIFTADATAGEISISKFPKLPNQVQNVLSKILDNN